MLEFCLRAGPISFVAWIGAEVAVSPQGICRCLLTTDRPTFSQEVLCLQKPDGRWTGFSPTHIQTLTVTLNVVESLFQWVNVFADLLLGIGFIMLSTLGSRRAAAIIDPRLKLVGAWTGGMFILAFVCVIVSFLLLFLVCDEQTSHELRAFPRFYERTRSHTIDLWQSLPPEQLIRRLTGPCMVTCTVQRWVAPRDDEWRSARAIRPDCLGNLCGACCVSRPDVFRTAWYWTGSCELD